MYPSEHACRLADETRTHCTSHDGKFEAASEEAVSVSASQPVSQPEPSRSRDTQRTVEKNDRRYATYSRKIVSVDRKARTAVFTINTDDVDRDNEIVLPSGGKFANYAKNPVVMYGHNYEGLPVGRGQWTRRTTEEGRPIVISKVEFAQTDFANDVFELVAGGFLSTASIGYMPRNSREPTEEEVKDNPTWANCRRLIDDWELLEWSIVPVPSNPHALARAVMKGLKLPKGLTLGTLGGADEAVKSDAGYDLGTWEPDAHEATFELAEKFEPDTFQRETLKRGSREYVAITGKHHDVENSDGEITVGERDIYKHFYPVAAWTADDAFLHAADRRGSTFIEAKNRIKRLAPATMEPEKVEVTRVMAPPEIEMPFVRRLTTDAEIRRIEEARLRGKIIL